MFLKRPLSLQSCRNVSVFNNALRAHHRCQDTKNSFFVLPYIAAFKTYWFWPEWNNTTRTQPRHYINENQNKTKHPSLEFIHLLQLQSYISTTESVRTFDARAYRTWSEISAPFHPNRKLLIPRAFKAATRYICQCYQCFSLGTWQSCYPSESHVITSVTALLRARESTRVIFRGLSVRHRVKSHSQAFWWHVSHMFMMLIPKMTLKLLPCTNFRDLFVARWQSFTHATLLPFILVV